MNAMTPPLKPRSGVLEVTPGRVRVFTDPETALDWTRPEDFAQGDAVQAIVLHAAPDAPELPRHVRAALAGLLGHVPFFAVPSGAPDCPLRRWAEAHGSIFDRLVTLEPGETPAGSLLRLERPAGTDLIEAVFADLAQETAQAYEQEAEYSPAEHWEARAQQFGTSARSVCYANAPRIINKMMHEAQMEALMPAIRRAASDMRRGSRPPALLEYGCGIGRLARYCRPHVRYHGADISRGMVETARTLNPGVRFFTTRSLPAADLPEIDIVMTVTVLHHNDRAERLKILKTAAARAGARVRLVLLEDLLVPVQIKSHNMYPLSVERLLDEIAMTFGGTCTQTGFRLLAYKPNDLVVRAALMELDVWR